jgi:LAO/AO transport system kinase
MADESTLSAEKEKALEEEIKASLIEGRLPCAVAFKISENQGVGRKTVGDMANKLEIKIAKCQLGCFP